MFKPIEDITVNGSKGEILNHYIYGSNLELGFSESPTKLTLNIVPKTSTAVASVFPINLTSPYRITIGSLILSKMYLYSYETSYTVGQQVATLNFIDGSFILDKIFVGLINRHLGVGEGNNVDFKIDAFCLDCEGIKLVKKSNLSISRKSASGTYVQGNRQRGGSIILGQEQFTEGFCDIPDVSYNFTNLKAGASRLGISIDIPDINPKYFQNYVGTLREVLSNWCADFGYTFYWDPASDNLKSVDLKIPVNNIDQIRNTINSANSPANFNGLALESYNQSKSLEGTVEQQHISRYLRPSRTKTINTSRVLKRTFPCVKPEKFNISKDSIARAVLGKYNDNARTLYCMKELQDMGKYIGLTQIFASENITEGNIENNIFTKIYDYGYKNDAITQFIENYNGAQLLIGVYNPALKEKYKKWESSIADMIGKYYQSSKQPIENARQCEPRLFYTKSVSLTPSAAKYTSKNKYDLPFADAVAGPEGADGVEWEIPTLWLFSRNTTYGTTQADYDTAMLNTDGTDPLEKIIFQYLPVEGAAYTLLFKAQSEAQKNQDTSTYEKVTNIINKIDELKNQSTTDGESRVVFIFLPPKSILDQFITTWSTKQNKLELEVDQKEIKKEPECITECEKNAVDEACGPCKQEEAPFVGLNTTTARTLKVTSFGKEIDLILPSENNYNGYETVESQQKIVVKGEKSIYGTITGPQNPNTMSLQVLESDITNDLISYDGTTIINMFVPNGAGNFEKLTPTAYHADLSQKLTNSITSSRDTISVSVIGTNLGTLSNYINPKMGLISYSINLNENGATTQLTFSTRPKVLPKREAISQKIAPTIKLNTYGRSTE